MTEHRIIDLSFTSPASATTTAYTSSVAFDANYSHAMFVATIQGGTGGVLDIYIQTSFDLGTTWVDVAHFAQLGAGAAAVIRAFSISKHTTSGTTPITIGLGATPALAANTVVPGMFGDRFRVVAVAGASTSAGAAQVVKALLS